MGKGDSVQSSQQFLELTPLDVEARVHRLSFSIRGFSASASDIARVKSDASQLETLADDYLASAHFRDTVKDMFSEIFLTRSEPVFPLLGDLAPSNLPDASWTTEQLKTFGQFGLAREIGEGPLELIASIAVAEPARPFSEIVTADHTYVGSVSRSVWSGGRVIIDPAGAPGFQAVVYT